MRLSAIVPQPAAHALMTCSSRIILAKVYLVFALLGSTHALSSSSSPIPPPPPLSVPVWSLACPTSNNDGKSSTSMNIVTFASPISIQPKLWMVALYHGTLTKDSFVQAKHGTLQLLRQPQAPLVDLLGKQSGRDVDKSAACAHAGYEWISPSEKSTTHKVLPECALYLPLCVESVVEDSEDHTTGDHVLALCTVDGSPLQYDAASSTILPASTVIPPLDEATDGILYTGLLRKLGLL